MKNKWYHLPKSEVLEKLSATAKGLSSAEAEKRIGEYGYNELEMKKEESLFSIFLRQFKSPLIYILLFAAGISFVVGKHTNGIVIFAVLMVNAVTGFIQEARARRSMAAGLLTQRSMSLARTR